MTPQVYLPGRQGSDIAGDGRGVLEPAEPVSAALKLAPVLGVAAAGNQEVEHRGEQ